MLEGKAGNDTLCGGTGDDVYFFEKGFGKDTIGESGGTDTIRFGKGISFSDIRVERRGSKAVLIVGEDEVAISSYANGVHNQIEKLELADGSIYPFSAVLKTIHGTAEDDTISGFHEGTSYYGYEGNDTLYGTNGADVLNGGSGNDNLQGGNGNDQLVGGSGNDTLYGGTGDDVYFFEKGFGKDTIGESGGTDTIRFGKGISFSDIRVERRGSKAVLIVGEDEVAISSYANGVHNQIEKLELADGSIYSMSDLYNSTSQSRSRMASAGTTNNTAYAADNNMTSGQLVAMMIQTYCSTSQDQNIYNSNITTAKETYPLADIFKTAI